MGYEIIGDTAMVLHFCFLGYVVFGGFVGWRWPRAFWPHLVIAAYGLGILIVDWPCVLTELEEWARVSNGGAPMPRGFIDYYLTGVLYSRDHILASRIAAAAVVLLSWAGIAARVVRDRRSASGPPQRSVKKA